MTISAAGIGSNLDVNSLLSQLMQLERQPVVALQKRQSEYQIRLSALGKVQNSVAALQGALGGIASLAALRKTAVTPSDASVASATASSGAPAGSYAVQIQQLAQQHKLASAAFSAPTDALGSGTLNIEYGSYSGGVFTPDPGRPAQSIAIGTGANTLAGVRDAINASGGGVAASIVNDGSGYRLALAARESGASNSLRITVADDDANPLDASGLSQLAFDPAATAGTGRNLIESVAAQDALATFDGIAVRSSANVFRDAIQGVSVTALKTGSIGLSVSQDTGATREAVQGFVTAYNSLNKTLHDLTAYNPDTRSASPLLGDASVRGLETGLRRILGRSVAGLAGGIYSLSDIGLRFASDGSLKIDPAVLDAALAKNFDAVAGLLAGNGSASDPLVQWTGSTTSTQSGSYALTVTQLATQGSLSGSAPAALAVVAGVNDTLDLTVDGVAASITIPAGNYASAAQLAAVLQSSVNGVAALRDADVSVAISAAGGVVSIFSSSYGGISQVQVSGGSGASDLLGMAPTAIAGQSAAGTINGVAARANGKSLVGALGDASESLQVRVGGGALGARGTLTYSQGIAAGLDRLLAATLASGGSLESRLSGVQTSIRDLTDRQAEMERRMSAIEARYRAQFTALDRMMASMNSTSSFLQQQLSRL